LISLNIQLADLGMLRREWEPEVSNRSVGDWRLKKRQFKELIIKKQSDRRIQHPGGTKCR
jgi:hypothetical protein